MKKLILCLLITTPHAFAQSAPPDPCKGDTACQYRLQAKKIQENREELLNTQKAQLQETQEQNKILEKQLDHMDQRQQQIEVEERQIPQQDNQIQPTNS